MDCDSLWINAAVGAIAVVQNIPSAMLYVDFLSRAVRNVEIRLRSALVRRLQMLSIGTTTTARTPARCRQKVLRDIESIEQMSRQIIDTGELAVVSIAVALVMTAIRMPVFVPVLFYSSRSSGWCGISWSDDYNAPTRISARNLNP